MDVISSTKNQRVKDWKKLLTKKGRKKAGRFLIEGFHLIEEAEASEDKIIEVMGSSAEDLEAVEAAGIIKRTLITKEVIQEISDTETTQGVFAVVELPKIPAEISFDKPLLLLDGVQDPGNLGTLIRTADAAGFSSVILGKGTVDAYNPKTLRSAQGSHFHISILEGDLEIWTAELRQRRIPVYGTALTGKSVSHKTIEPSSLFGLIVGNEGNGVSEKMLNLTDKNLHIPMKGQAESLNVAVAAGILMFHLYS